MNHNNTSQIAAEAPRIFAVNKYNLNKRYSSTEVYLCVVSFASLFPDVCTMI